MKISIKYKIAGYFSILFLMSLIILIYFTNSMINKNNEYVIKKEVIDIKKHSDIYLKQLFLTNTKVTAEDFFKNYGKQITEDLSYKIGNRVVLYSKIGDLIFDSSEKQGFVNGSNTDLLMAKNNKIAYSINYNKNVVDVNFSYVANLDNKAMGIIRYKIDYSDLYKSGNDLINMIKLFSIILFIAIASISFIISKGITVPIEKLNNLTKKISEGDLNISMDIKSKDEIGELSKNFSVMADKIKTQLNKIQKDSDEIKVLEGHRKIFFDNVTHELKTPLTTILGYAEVIQENGFKSDEKFFEKGINYIITESQRLRRMVIDLLQFSQIQNENVKADFKPLNISELLNGTCEELQIKAKRYNIKIKCHIHKDIILIGDKDKLKQVIINVIDNSIKYGFENSELMVTTAIKGSSINISVEDRGEGIAEDKLQDIFKPFFRANKLSSRENGSKGLGLAISKAIIDKHGGNISITSKPNVGTLVIIELFTTLKQECKS
ncbi:MAG: HAMP domain-containing histidine kinase [Clostridiaceae bacterium]|nr:HAMP domain-containing histidine kinase [Clostridiaceae bacterium]